MDVKLINPFINAAINVISTMCQVKPVPGKPTLKKDNLTWGMVTGLIGMAGNEVSGNMLISFDEASILEIVSKMLSEEFKEINKDVVDAVGELTNMISGGAKKELSEMGYQFSMAIPAMIVGKNVALSQLGGAAIISVPFSTTNGKFVIEANLAPVGKKS